jgi:hypothetical protein
MMEEKVEFWIEEIAESDEIDDVDVDGGVKVTLFVPE